MKTCTAKNTNKTSKPFQIRLRPGTREKLQKMAKVNGLKMTDTVNLCLAAGMPIIENRLGEFNSSETPKAA